MVITGEGHFGGKRKHPLQQIIYKKKKNQKQNKLLSLKQCASIIKRYLSGIRSQRIILL
jgi:hypothetical protein